MMDTVLNLGLNDATVKGLAAAPTSASPTTATAASCRCTRDVVLDDPARALRVAHRGAPRRARGIQLDIELTRGRLAAHRARVPRDRRGAHGGRPFPQDPEEQLWGAIAAVFRSWENDRARRLPQASTASPTSWGTAVNVQAMVFGNMGDGCATGVAFTRDPSTGDKHLLRRVPEERAGRRRGRRHPHAAAHQPPEPPRGQDAAADARRGDAARLPGARAHLPEAREALPRHAGHRVHDPERQALDAPDAHRQAHRRARR